MLPTRDCGTRHAALTSIENMAKRRWADRSRNPVVPAERAHLETAQLSAYPSPSRRELPADAPVSATQGAMRPEGAGRLRYARSLSGLQSDIE